MGGARLSDRYIQTTVRIGRIVRWVGRGRRSDEQNDKTRQDNIFSLSLNPKPCTLGKDKPFGPPHHSNVSSGMLVRSREVAQVLVRVLLRCISGWDSGRIDKYV